jgi:hypothetical protein
MVWEGKQKRKRADKKESYGNRMNPEWVHISSGLTETG